MNIYFRSLVVAIAIVIGTLTCGGAFAGYIFNDTFESETLNATPSGWIASTFGDATFSATVKSETGNQFVHLISTAGGTAARLQKTFGVGTPSALWAPAATIDYDIRFNGTGNDSTVWSRLGANFPDNGPSDSDTDVFVGYTNTASGGNQQLGLGGPISLGAWHHVQIQMDMISTAVVAGDNVPRGTFTVYVDSTLKSTGPIDTVGGFWGTTPAGTGSPFGIRLNSVGFGNWFGTSLNMDVDNVSVLVPEPSSCGLLFAGVTGAVMRRRARADRASVRA
jgi:hypothetical protein